MAGKKALEGASTPLCKRPWKKLLFVVIVAAAVYRYTQLDDSKKRFIKHLAKQVPYLPARYYA